MQNLRAVLLLIVAVLAVGALGWWAIRTIEPGDIHAEREKQKALAERNRELEKEMADLKDQLALLQPPEETEQIVEEESPPPAPEQSSKYASLISELQKLIDDKVYMKVGSKGTRVGTVQNFLNIYFKTNKRIDNDYGKGMKTDIINFQKAVGLAADGEAGPVTYQKMIDWLKKQ